MIVRTPQRERYTIVANAAIEDPRLRWKAKGILFYLLSKPDGWEVRVADLERQGPDGRDAVLGGLRELEKCGYLKRERRRGQHGRFDDQTTIVFESPQTDYPLSVTTRGKEASSQVAPQTPKPQTDKPTVTNTERTNTEQQQDSRFRAVALFTAQVRSSQSWVEKPVAVRKATLKAITGELATELTTHLAAHPDDDECARSFVAEHWPTDEDSRPTSCPVCFVACGQHTPDCSEVNHG
jgi:hypothetical protein